VSDPTPDQLDSVTTPSSEPGARAQFMASWRASLPILLLMAGAGLLIAGASYAVLTKPMRPYSTYLERAERLITEESYDLALEKLNTEIFAYLQDPALTPTQVGWARVLTARSIYLGQNDLGIEIEENNSNIVNEYLAAEELGVTLTPDDVYYLADTFGRLGRVDRAIRRVDTLPPDRRENRARIYKALVEQVLEQPAPDYEQVLEWTNLLGSDTGLAAEFQIWVVATRSRVRLAQGFVEEAVERLIQALVRFEGAGQSRGSLADLYMLLGQGYAELGEVEQARVQYEKAANALGVGEPKRGQAELSLARLEPDVDRRLGRFRDLVETYATTEWMLPGLLGLAETLADEDDLAGSKEIYDQLIQQLLERGPQGGLDRTVVANSLLIQHKRQMDSGNTSEALSFGSKIEPLFEFAELPDDVLTELARSNRLLADEMLPDGGEIGLSWTDLEGIDPSTRVEAQSRLLSAARYFAEFARRVVLTSNDEYAGSLWQAAHAYDLGGDIQRAIIAYEEFATGFPNDARRFEAGFRLAQAFQVTGQHTRAAKLYEDLIAGRGSVDTGRGAVLYGEASYVPLAQTLLADSIPENDARAQQLLEQVVSGSLVGPGAASFREALFELTRLHFVQGQHARAIERLEETIARFPEDPRIAVARYRLAEAYRRLSKDLRTAVDEGGRPDSEMQELERSWEESLRKSLSLFDEAIAALDAVDQRRRDDLQTLSLRNAYFYRGDCAFDLKDYEAAISYYDEARDRYASDPAALVAMVQIVNAHIAMGDLDRARTANERARRFYQGLPAEVWDDPYLPMGRGEWERWLNSTDVLYSRVGND
jgi:tetratricopeptide (TPR) repeat protein